MRSLVIPLFLLSWLASAQEKPEPTVLFLYPADVIIPQSIKPELTVYDKEIEITTEIRNSYVTPGLSPNWKTIRENELEFVKRQNFATLLVIGLSRELTYRAVQHFDNILIYPLKKSLEPNKVTYKILAEQYSMSWLVNVHKIELSRTGSTNQLTVSVELYNPNPDWVFVDSTYTVDDTALDAAACEEGIWYCLSEKLKITIIDDLEDKIQKNRHHHK